MHYEYLIIRPYFLSVYLENFHELDPFVEKRRGTTWRFIYLTWGASQSFGHTSKEQLRFSFDHWNGSASVGDDDGKHYENTMNPFIIPCSVEIMQ